MRDVVNVNVYYQHHERKHMYNIYTIPLYHYHNPWPNEVALFRRSIHCVSRNDLGCAKSFTTWTAGGANTVYADDVDDQPRNDTEEKTPVGKMIP